MAPVTALLVKAKVAVEIYVRDFMHRLRRRGRAAALRSLRLTGAAVAAYVVADALLSGVVPILAPLTAILVVEVTLAGSVTSGVQRVVSVVAGVLLAVGFSALVELSWWSLGGLIAASIIIGQLLKLGPHLLEVPISAMLVLAVGGAEETARDRIVETLIGAFVGVAVNLMFPPAVRPGTAAAAVESFAEEIAEVLDRAGAEMFQALSQEQALPLAPGRAGADPARAAGRPRPGPRRGQPAAQRAGTGRAGQPAEPARWGGRAGAHRRRGAQHVPLAVRRHR